jgi:hypothetical protein
MFGMIEQFVSTASTGIAREILSVIGQVINLPERLVTTTESTLHSYFVNRDTQEKVSVEQAAGKIEKGGKAEKRIINTTSINERFSQVAFNFLWTFHSLRSRVFVSIKAVL